LQRTGRDDIGRRDRFRRRGRRGRVEHLVGLRVVTDWHRIDGGRRLDNRAWKAGFRSPGKVRDVGREPGRQAVATLKIGSVKPIRRTWRRIATSPFRACSFCGLICRTRCQRACPSAGASATRPSRPRMFATVGEHPMSANSHPIAAVRCRCPHVRHCATQHGASAWPRPSFGVRYYEPEV
jgi:hypothetical protein